MAVRPADVTNPIFKAGGEPIPDVAESPGGHLWDICLQTGCFVSQLWFLQSVPGEEEGVEAVRTISDCRRAAARGPRSGGVTISISAALI